MMQTAKNTTVMLLAAGHGKRMLPLTENTPKPLLKAGSRSLIEHHIVKLAEAGFEHLVINIAHLGEQIRSTLGNGTAYGLDINYSDETADGPLETAGGIYNALSLIPSDFFIVINADIFTDYNFADLLRFSSKQAHQGHLVLVNNPAHNQDGDFSLSDNGLLINKLQHHSTYTFSGIAGYKKALFQESSRQNTKVTSKKQALAPLFYEWIKQEKLSASLHAGKWLDVGTPKRLRQLNTDLAGSIIDH